MIRKWDIKDKEIKKKCIDEVITCLQEIEDSEVGFITAQDLIDIVAENFGPEIYNLALIDIKKFLQQKLADLEVDLDLLAQSS